MGNAESVVVEPAVVPVASSGAGAGAGVVVAVLASARTVGQEHEFVPVVLVVETEVAFAASAFAASAFAASVASASVSPVAVSRCIAVVSCD